MCESVKVSLTKSTDEVDVFSRAMRMVELRKNNQWTVAQVREVSQPTLRRRTA